MQWLNTLWKKYRDSITAQHILIAFGIIVVGVGYTGYLIGFSPCEVNCPNEVDGVLALEEISDVSVEEEFSTVCVDVSGAVKNPGVYCSDTATKLNEFISLADGMNVSVYAEKYVAQSINLASKIEDGDKVYIPFQSDIMCEIKLEESPIGKDGGIITDGLENDILGVADSKDGEEDSENADPNSESVECVDLNSATMDEFVALDGVGESTAAKIIAARPYAEVADLLDVSGIGDAKYAGLKDFVCVK